MRKCPAGAQQYTALWSPEQYTLGVPLCWLRESFCCGRLTVVGMVIDVAAPRSGWLLWPCLVHRLPPVVGRSRSCSGFEVQERGSWANADLVVTELGPGGGCLWVQGLLELGQPVDGWDHGSEVLGPDDPYWWAGPIPRLELGDCVVWGDPELVTGHW